MSLPPNYEAVRNTDDEILKVARNKRHLTGVAASRWLRVLFVVPPPHPTTSARHRLPNLFVCEEVRLEYGGGELLSTPVYLLLTSSQQFCS